MPAPLHPNRPKSMLWGLRESLRHLALLVRNPHDPDTHAARFIDSTEGTSQARAYEEFVGLESSAPLVASLPDPVLLLEDRPALAAAAPASLGRVYLDFLEANDLRLGHIMDLVAEFSDRRSEDAPRAWFRRRTAAAHDLRHVLTGYDASHLGEYCNLCFRFAQTGHRGVGVLIGFAAIVLLAEGNLRVFSAGLEAWRRGRSSAAIDLFPWEDYLRSPLAEARAALGLTPSRHFPDQIEPGAYGLTPAARGSGAAARRFDQIRMPA